MEYVEETLNDCIYGRHNSLKDILNYSEQIICAVNLLHKSQIVHRDLKPENILVQNSKSK
jgi:serine/threonine protein kinase